MPKLTDPAQTTANSGRIPLLWAISLGIVLFAIGRSAGLSIAPADWLRRPQYSARSQRELVERAWPLLQATRTRLGDTAISVTVVQFVDYHCRACRQFHNVLDTLLRSGRIAVAIVHLPQGGLHSTGRNAARAALCAEVQHNFARMHAILMTSDTWESNSSWGAVALQAGVNDTATFQECMRSGSTEHRLRANQAFAERLGITEVPAFVTPDRIIPGVLPSRVLGDFVREE